jgi:outer membrane protein OmpA-like peptidoglycan-associated protein
MAASRQEESGMKRVVEMMMLLVFVFALSSCSLLKNVGRNIGRNLGGMAGNAVGGYVNPTWGRAIGGKLGGALGGFVGEYMDKQMAEMKSDLAQVKVERFGEGIKLTFDATILFDVSKAELKSVGQEDLTKFARILNKYANTIILVEGHTDATGSEERNMELSRQRAQAVADFLIANQVQGSRFTVTGNGETKPIADNATAEGRSANRRVEVSIFADDELKKKADPRA